MSAEPNISNLKECFVEPVSPLVNPTPMTVRNEKAREVYGTEVIPRQASGFSQHYGFAYTRGSKQLSSWTVNMDTRTWSNRFDVTYTSGTNGPSNGLGMIYYPAGKPIFTGDTDTALNRIGMNDTSTSNLFVWTITEGTNQLNFTWLKNVAMSSQSSGSGGYPYNLSVNAYNSMI